MKRMAEAKEIAQAAMFLLSDRSSFVTRTPMLTHGGVSVHLV
jgi:enoyl-[acyl-carrier-protein] reductase (NADH)